MAHPKVPDSTKHTPPACPRPTTPRAQATSEPKPVTLGPLFFFWERGEQSTPSLHLQLRLNSLPIPLPLPRLLFFPNTKPLFYFTLKLP